MSISRLLVLVSFLPVLGGCSAATPETPGPDAGPGAARTVADYPLIPFPAQLTPRAGSFRLDPATMIILSDPGDQELRALARYAAELIRERTGVALTVSDRHARGAEAGAILLLREESAEANVEGYRLEASGDRIVVSAPAHAGLFYGIQTLRQLTPPAGNAEYVDVPAVEIVDRPRFVYRGMHLDVGRHFFPVSFVKKYIDLLAMYKMNTFHWHLTEDQGWRIEIKRYPLLTEVGAYRKETLLARNFDPYIGDRKPYGGFYTQDEV
ncbi:MAG TPA: family 20 glycosylhydrolase, partial [Gemmatimonadota bacterium]|nr:family 20 glycosylhydrolase [Gemmatimonadota bacterium]